MIPAAAVRAANARAARPKPAGPVLAGVGGVGEVRLEGREAGPAVVAQRRHRLQQLAVALPGGHDRTVGEPGVLDLEVFQIRPHIA